MTNFELLKEECENYIELFGEEDLVARLDMCQNFEVDGTELIWGTTNYNSFLEVVLQVKKPKRFVVFGSSIGYQCFFWNNIFPDIPCVGIDLMDFRVDWGRKMISKYLVNNVEFVVEDLKNFQIEDGDLIWQNNLMFNSQEISEYSQYLLKNFDVEIISYQCLKTIDSIFDVRDFQFIDNKGNLKLFKEKNFLIDTSWTGDQNLIYYYRYQDNFKFDVNYILPEFIIPEKFLKDYTMMNSSKKFVISDTLRKYYNKFYLKDKFNQLGFNVPKTYFYTEKKTDLTEQVSNLTSFVAKPVHMSESNGLFIKYNSKHKIDTFNLNKSLNSYIELSDKNNWRNSPIEEEIYWKDTTPGVIIEEYISVVYELKVFVVFGEPVIADLREGSTEIQRLDFINLRNQYLNWDKEYQLIIEFAKELKIDFFRIDFLYDGNKLYATECAFMPGTYLPDSIEELIANKLRMPYLRHYYPQLC